MLTARTQDLELAEVWIASDPENARVRPAFPINKHTGAAGSGVVYFELEPGKRLARHTDSAEEILYIVAGTAEAEAGGEHGTVSAGDLAVIPAMVPHALRNLGDETLKVVGFFADATIVSDFEEPLMPMGVTQMEQGAPQPVPAA
jgi:quercetin dioxygenase-like cupin family protein